MSERRDMPLFAWGDALRATRVRRARLRRRAAIAATGIGLLGATIASPPIPRLVWNASASAPIGLYAVSPGATIARGDMVIAWPPREARRLAAERHYLPSNVPLLKRVAAIPGDRVCATEAMIWIENRRVAMRKERDRAGRAMPWWGGCVTLRNGELLLLNAPPDSFDGRYFGPSRAVAIVGKATPLWLR